MWLVRLAVPCCWLVVASMAPGTARPDLLVNGDFDVDVVPWADPFANPETVVTWSPVDASGSALSGSLQVETNQSNGTADGPQGECLTAPPGVYTLSARVFVESGVGQPAAAIVMLVILLVTGNTLFGYSPNTYLWLLLIAIFPQLIGHSTYNWSLRYLPVALVAVTTLGEPIGSSILAFIILKETPAALQIVGGALILAGIYVTSQKKG